MEEALIENLERSFKSIAPRGPELVDHFYAHLFSKNPDLRPLFPRDMSVQKGKLLASLMLVIRSLRSPEKLRQPLMDLGKRHVGYKTRPEHYPILRDTLIGVMRDMTGPQWNEQLTLAWTDALNYVAAEMIEGHKQGEKTRAHAGAQG